MYFHLDKRPYISVNTPEKLDKLIEDHITNSEYKYLFIDEIQNKKIFESAINAWREEDNISIFITGSNSVCELSLNYKQHTKRLSQNSICFETAPCF